MKAPTLEVGKPTVDRCGFKGSNPFPSALNIFYRGNASTYGDRHLQ